MAIDVAIIAVVTIKAGKNIIAVFYVILRRDKTFNKQGSRSKIVNFIY